MFRHLGTSALAAVLSLAAGGCGRTSSPPITEPNAAVTTSEAAPSTIDSGEVTMTVSTVPAPGERPPTSIATTATTTTTTTIAPMPTSTATTIATTASTTTVLPTIDQHEQELRILRPDGIGPHDFGAEISVVMSWGTELFGTPTVGDGEATESVVPNLMRICGDQVAAHWETPTLDLYFAQWEFDENGLVSCTGPVRLVAWGVGSYLGANTSTSGTSRRLTTADRIGVGTTVAGLIELDADPIFMRWSGLGGAGFYPAGFSLGDPVLYEQLYGVLAWDWVRDLQAALNDHGYQLTVDGEAGPRTRAALEAYRVEHQLPSTETAILDLALEPDGDVQIASMASGLWALEFECGTLQLTDWGFC